MQYTIDELYTKKEGQTYDRKSARKDPKSLSNHIVAFANADGGTLVIGIEDDFTVTGIDDYHERVNDILRVPYDYCKPSVTVMTEFVDCMDGFFNLDDDDLRFDTAEEDCISISFGHDKHMSLDIYFDDENDMVNEAYLSFISKGKLNFVL